MVCFLLFVISPIFVGEFCVGPYFVVLYLVSFLVYKSSC